MAQQPNESVPLSESLRSGLSNLSARSGPETGRVEDCGDFGIRILRDGTWLYHGSPITRKPLVRLFATVLRREGDDYWLVTPVERGRIVVDDAPFTAVEMTITGAGAGQRVSFRTNLDDTVTADAAHPLRVALAADGEPSPYIEVRNGLEALIVRSVYYELVERGETRLLNGEESYGIWSAGIFFRLG
ncbi:MAG TPA: DUF1285 domain-containing protein [Candidatus Sulfotelmatobacter sp.]|nr:DUF1285 domain-containing protein [Candidatus Sulfotelmatobacter sp.]